MSYLPVERGTGGMRGKEGTSGGEGREGTTT